MGDRTAIEWTQAPQNPAVVMEDRGIQLGEPARHVYLARESRHDELRVALGNLERRTELIRRELVEARHQAGDIAVNGVIGADDLPTSRPVPWMRASRAASRWVPPPFARTAIRAS